jgi:hypothetical protein
VDWGGHAVHYIYDSSSSWLDTRTSVESSKPMSYWNDVVMQCNIYHRPLSCTSWPPHSTKTYVGNVLLKFLYQARIVSCHIYSTLHDRLIPLRHRLATFYWSYCSGMRRSCSTLYIWQLTILAWYKYFSREFQAYALVDWGGHAG